MDVFFAFDSFSQRRRSDDYRVLSCPIASMMVVVVPVVTLHVLVMLNVWINYDLRWITFYLLFTSILFAINLTTRYCLMFFALLLLLLLRLLQLFSFLRLLCLNLFVLVNPTSCHSYIVLNFFCRLVVGVRTNRRKNEKKSAELFVGLIKCDLFHSLHTMYTHRRIHVFCIDSENKKLVIHSRFCSLFVSSFFFFNEENDSMCVYIYYHKLLSKIPKFCALYFNDTQAHGRRYCCCCHTIASKHAHTHKNIPKNGSTQNTQPTNGHIHRDKWYICSNAMAIYLHRISWV